jgi:hypothetical protein
MFKRGLLAGLLLSMVVALPASAATPALDWNGPYFVAPQTIADIDCPSTGLCLAADVEGNVISSTSPTGTETSWSAADVTSSSPRSISCATTSLCVAVGTDGEIITSTDPTGGAAAWTTTDIPGVAYLGAVDCAPGVCAALDIEGRLLLSDNPAGGAGEWTIGEGLGNQFFLAAIDCPSSALCVAVGSENHNLGGGLFVQENLIFTITDPVGPDRETKKTYLGPRSYIRAISCPTTSFCVAVDKWGETWISTDPTGGAAAWPNQWISSQELLTDISCPTASFCTVVDENDQALTTNEPAGDKEAWAATTIPSGLLNVSCPSTSLCVAAGLNEVAVGTPPTPEKQAPPIETPPPGPTVISPASLFLQPSAITVKNNRAKLIVTCLGPYVCSGRAKIAVTSKGSYRTIGDSRFSISGRKVVTVKLNSRGRELFEDKRQTRARVQLSGSSSAGQSLALRQQATLKLRG